MDVSPFGGKWRGSQVDTGLLSAACSFPSGARDSVIWALWFNVRSRQCYLFCLLGKDPIMFCRAICPVCWAAFCKIDVSKRNLYHVLVFPACRWFMHQQSFGMSCQVTGLGLPLLNYGFLPPDELQQAT